MGLRNTLPLFALLLTFSADGALAQPADIDGVRAASKAFHDAVVVVDDGTAMEKVWAWEIGTESGLAQMKDGSTRKVDWIVTNVYEKIDGRWLTVSHHVQPKPQ